jgi:filamentous hemagglutinin
MTSSINPLNIDSNYPVAGVPNNTQGFRDNFTNIQSNFQFAADEITELQTKSILKAALTGSTLDNNMSDNLIYAALIRDFSGSISTNTATSGAVTIDYSAAHYHVLNPNGSMTLSFTNLPTSGTLGMWRIRFVVTNVAYTITFPAAVSVGTTGVQGLSGSILTFAQTGTFEFGFTTTTGGSTITIFDLNRPLSYFTNAVNVAATTAASSTTTGALIVAGGVGVAGNLYVGGDIFGNVSITDISTGNVTAAGNVVSGNIVTTGLITATGNVTGGNVITPGLASVTGNITGGNISTAGLATVTGNITAGNVNTAGLITATGNVGGGNLNTPGLVSATANVVGGNITTAGIVSATANITGGNIITGGIVSATGNISAGNISAGDIAITGNISDTSALTITSGSGGNITLSPAGIVVATANIFGTGGVFSNSITAGVGYALGAGASIVQSGNRAAGVIINSMCGAITLVSAAGNTVPTTFTMTNTTIAQADTIILNQRSGTNLYNLLVSNVQAGSANITVFTTGGTVTEAPVINFAVFKAVQA